MRLNFSLPGFGLGINRQRLSRYCIRGTAFFFLLALPTSVAAAEKLSEGREEAESESAQQSRRRNNKPDFLFNAPKVAIGFRGGVNISNAGSEIFDFINEQLTIGDSDFIAPAVAFDFSYYLRPRLAAVLRVEWNSKVAASEFREFEDQNDLPITQETELSQVPVTGNLKFYLNPRGRKISEYVWIPNSFAPYVGGGGGLLWYRFAQRGDFIDFVDMSIFSDQFVSEGFTWTAQVFGGVDVKLTHRVYLTFEACYFWARAGMGQDFMDFDSLDLSGFRTTGGIFLVF